MNLPRNASPSPAPSLLHSGKGAVLIIVLSFIVLLAGLVVAFFSQAVFDRQVSNNSANTTKVDIFARSAADVIICDLKQEIAAGSTLLTATGASTTPVYKMASNQTAVPYRMASGTSATFPNLLKESAYNQPFYAGANYDTTNYPVPNRAANLSSTTASLNNRVVSLPRWNKPLLLPKKTPTSASDQTPDPSFKAPDWVLVERSGTNPQLGNSNVIGRYAYTVYDEGGLLDINVAGYPTVTGSSLSNYKNALSYADLHRIPGISDLSPTQQDAAINAIVGWRNYASLQPTGTFPNFTIPSTSATNYYTAVQANAFLRAGNTALYNGQSDRLFSSRQELLNFIQSMGDTTQRANLQKAMQYFGTFSRDLNQPSLVPAHIIDATAPKIVYGDGGNNASTADFSAEAAINPAFLTIRAGASVKRNDGSTPVAGEPLVKKRFALSRLAWITCKGPSGNATRLPTGDIVFTETAKALGWETSKATAWLKQGTDDAVLKYFGLEWDGANKRWNYAAHLTTTADGPHISTLQDVAAANREPDFIELLKASINAGALGKGATRYLNTPVQGDSGITGAVQQFVVPQAWEDYQYRQDISIDAQVLQIAANIIDQSDVDGYPTRIYYNDGTTVGTREIVGVESLPYFYRIRAGIVRAEAPNPPGLSGTGTQKILGANGGNPTIPPVTLHYPGEGIAPAGYYETLTKTGLQVFMLQPELWNPHDQNNPRATDSSLVPTQFRFVADSTSPDQAAGGTHASISICTRTAGPYVYVSGTPSWSGGRPNGDTNRDDTIPFDYYENYPMSLTSANSELDFTVTGVSSSLFTEPTLLIRPGIPAGSNLALGNQHSIKIFSSPPLSGSFQKLAAAFTSGNNQGIKSIQDYKTYIGLYLAVGPIRWVTKLSGTSYILTANNMGPAGDCKWSIPTSSGTMTAWDSGITFRVQCQDAFNNWVTYDQKYSQEGRNLVGFTCGTVDGGADWTNTAGLIGSSEWASCIDPRTSRFGMQGSNGYANPTYPTNVPGSSPTPLNINQAIIYSNRWNATLGSYMVHNPAYTTGTDINPSGSGWGLPAVGGWYPKTTGAYWPTSTPFYFGLFAENSGSNAQYYSDADGVVRRAMSAYNVGTTTTIGKPLANATTSGITSIAQSQSRPIILNRPFRSVAELGYVFSGTPWKNLDMFTPESGFTGLLDAFCVNDADTSSGVVAGKVNLNTRQEPVLEAILAGAYVDEMTHYASAPTWKLSSLAATDATTLATALVNRTKDSSTTKGPLRNLAELVGKWTGSVAASSGAIDGSQSYHGFSEDLVSGTATINNISRMREASMRALANCGTTRVWNLMIDVIAQTGRYPSTVTDPAKFIVDGERRYWLHVAIDRATGEVIDQNLEIVRE